LKNTKVQKQYCQKFGIVYEAYYSVDKILSLTTYTTGQDDVKRLCDPSNNFDIFV